MSLFGRLLERHERERHALIVRGVPVRHASRSLAEGYLPVDEAAVAMGVSEAEVQELARRGVLTSTRAGGELLILPAIVSRLAVRTSQ